MVNDKKMLKMAFSHVLTSVDKTPAKIRKIDKDFAKKLDFKHWHAKLEILYIVSVILVMRKEKHSQSMF